MLLVLREGLTIQDLRMKIMMIMLCMMKHTKIQNVEFSGDSYKVKHSNENLPIIPNNNKKYSSKLMKRGELLKALNKLEKWRRRNN